MPENRDVCRASIPPWGTTARQANPQQPNGREKLSGRSLRTGDGGICFLRRRSRTVFSRHPGLHPIRRAPWQMQSAGAMPALHLSASIFTRRQDRKDVADALRYLVATKSWAVVERKLKEL